MQINKKTSETRSSQENFDIKGKEAKSNPVKDSDVLAAALLSSLNASLNKDVKWLAELDSLKLASLSCQTAGSGSFADSNRLGDGPPPPPAPSNPKGWTPPAKPANWDNMSIADQEAFLQQCISAAECAISNFQNEAWNDRQDTQFQSGWPPIWINTPPSQQALNDAHDCDTAVAAIQGYAAQCTAMLAELKAPPPVDPFAGHNFHMPHIKTININDLTSSEMQDIAIALAEVLSQLEEIIGLAGSGKNAVENQIANAHVDAAQAALDKAKADLQTLNVQIAAQAHESLFNKIFGAIVSAIMVAIACVTQQYYLAALMCAMTLATSVPVTSGGKTAMDLFTNALSSTFQNLGMSKSVADMLAAVMVIIVVVAVSSGAGDMAAMAEEAPALAEKAAADTKGVISRMVDWIAENTSTGTKYAIIMGLQAFQGTNFIATITPFLAKLSEKDREIVQALIQTIVGLLTLIVGGLTMASLPEAGVADFMQKLTRLKPILSGLMIAFTAASSATEFAIGATTLKLSAAELELSKDQADESFFENLFKSITATVQADSKSLGSTLKSQADELIDLQRSQSQADSALASALRA